MSEENLKKKGFDKYKNVIMIDEDIADHDFYNQLKKDYPYKKEKELTIFYTHES